MVGDRHVQLCRGNGLFHRLQSSQGSTVNGSPSKVTHTVVGRIQSFVVGWQASVSCWLLAEVEKAMAPSPVLLPGKPHGRRSLVGCSPWGRYKSDTTERLHFHFSLFLPGKSQRRAAVYGVAQSRIRLKRLSSSSFK